MRQGVSKVVKCLYRLRNFVKWIKIAASFNWKRPKNSILAETQSHVWLPHVTCENTFGAGAACRYHWASCCWTRCSRSCCCCCCSCSGDWSAYTAECDSRNESWPCNVSDRRRNFSKVCGLRSRYRSFQRMTPATWCVPKMSVRSTGGETAHLYRSKAGRTFTRTKLIPNVTLAKNQLTRYP